MNCLLLSDLTMKTTTNSRQTSHMSHIHMHTLCYKEIHLHSSNEETSQNKPADLDDNSTSFRSYRYMVTVKSLYKLALHKILLGDAFVSVDISKFYLLHSHA